MLGNSWVLLLAIYQYTSGSSLLLVKVFEINTLSHSQKEIVRFSGSGVLIIYPKVHPCIISDSDSLKILIEMPAKANKLPLRTFGIL